MIVIDGKGLAAQIRSQLKNDIDVLKENGERIPGLATVLVGDDPASRTYVHNKHKGCADVGIVSQMYQLPERTTRDELLALIEILNANNDTDGILVQLPLPKHIDEAAVIEAIDPRKDVDGFHPMNIGKMVLGEDVLIPCTPAGILELLKHYTVKTEGKHVVVIGRSNIVGKPIAFLLGQKRDGANAIVTVCHSKVKDIGYYTRQADILIAAAGKAQMVTGNMVKEGAVVIDVGINSVSDPVAKSGMRLVGDVDFQSVAPKCSYITPVPGGVGPMTIAMLLKQTFKIYQMRNNYVR